MNHWLVFALGVVVGLVVVRLLRRGSVVKPQGGTEYIRPRAVVSPEAMERARLEKLRNDGTLTASEYETLLSRFTSGEAAPELGALRTVTILTGGKNKINDIKTIRTLTHLGLKDAKDLADSLPQVLASNVSPNEAARMRQMLEAAGMTVHIN